MKNKYYENSWKVEPFNIFRGKIKTRNILQRIELSEYIALGALIISIIALFKD